jgi:hypothetical protein
MPNNKHPLFCAWCSYRIQGNSLCKNAIFSKRDGHIIACKIKTVQVNMFGKLLYRKVINDKVITF